ncbi:hypothetical protein IBX38_02555 [Candidatus Bathyarchaeota archaeon]|nr:hypothetical protein [Candidatus Bathyarchaeota archaeon]
MIVSIGAIMYSAGTYYRYEQWEEYITLVEHVRLNTIRLVEISLANYTAPGNNSTSILKDNLNQWQNDLRKAYPGYGVVLTYNLADGTNINYSQGLASHWNANASYSAANATFNLNITSIGLTGYKFMATAFLRLTILNVTTSTNEITVAVTGEDGMPITDLKKDNFQVDDLNITSVTSSYDRTYLLVYIIKCDGSIPALVTVTVRDQRGIQVVAKT